MKKIFIFLIVLCFLSMGTISSQNISDYLKSMPQTLLPPSLDSFGIDLLLSDSTSNDEPKCEILTPDYIKIKTSEIGNLQLKLLPRKKGKPIICVIRTVAFPVCQSSIRFYDRNWSDITQKIKMNIDPLLFYKKNATANKNFRNYQLEAGEESICAKFNGKENRLVLKLDTARYGNDDLKKRIIPFIKKTTVIMKWNGTSFHQ